MYWIKDTEQRDKETWLKYEYFTIQERVPRRTGWFVTPVLDNPEIRYEMAVCSYTARTEEEFLQYYNEHVVL